MAKNYVIICVIHIWVLSFGLGVDICALESRIDTSETFTYNSGTGQIVICLKCPPGSHVIRGKQCYSAHSIDHCHCCPANQFQPDFVGSVQQCADCHVCRQNEIEVRKCSPAYNTKCVCKEGMYHEMEYDLCTNHAQCSEGFGVVAKGNNTRNTRCEPCKMNQTYSNVRSALAPCQPCSLCAPGERVTSACTTENDTVCALIEMEGNGNRLDLLALLVLVPVVGGVLCVVCICRYKAESFCIDRRNKKGKEGKEEDVSGKGQQSLVSPNISENDGSVVVCKEQDHTKNYDEIYRKLFLHTAQNLTWSWRCFIRHLPWGNRNVDSVIEVAEYRQKCLPDIIYFCLWEFKQQSNLTPDEFIENISDDYTSIRESLREIYTQHRES